jgi:hypothetical protein
MYALSGAHRTGKTTLAIEVANKLGIHYHDASTSKIAKAAGINIVGDLSIAERLTAQELILDKFIEGVKAAPRPAICDRCPLDMIGYMLAEVTMHNTPLELHQRIQDYVEKCLAMATLHFDMVLMLRPLPTYKVDPDKPPPNVAYQSAVQYAIEGAAQQAADLHSGVVLTTNFEGRVEAVSNAIKTRLEQLVEETRSLTRH